MRFFILGLLVFSWVVRATDHFEPVETTVHLVKAYLPLGFDSNDQASFAIGGIFPNTCYQIGDYEKTVSVRANSKNEIRILQKALIYDGYCLNVAMPFHRTVSVGVLKPGEYEVIDDVSNQKLGSLKVKPATHAGPGTDDHIYAYIQDAMVVSEGGTNYEVLLEGLMTHRCMYIEDIRVQYNDSVVVVLPIVDMHTDESRCRKQSGSFSQRVGLKKLDRGTYLLHVRSMNGTSIDKVFLASSSQRLEK